MKKFRICICLGTAFLMAMSLTACSATQVLDDIVEDTAELPDPTPTPESSIKELKTIDSTIAAPVFEKELDGVVPMAKGGTFEMDGTAVSTDGGTITYQWYRNNVDSNGGGTMIPGATEAKYIAAAEELGSVFYYVVAANNHGTSCNMATSGTFEVITLKDGEWVKDEFGKKYINEDGTYPTEYWMVIDGDTYHFDSAGYVSVGWLAVGNAFYYFDKDGKILANAKTPDGFETDSDGKMIGFGAPELSPTTAEIAAAAQEAAAKAAEEEAIAREMEAAQEAEEAAEPAEEPAAAD